MHQGRCPKFELGRIMPDHEALERLFPFDILDGLERHQSGDYGTVCEELGRANAHNLQHGASIESQYISMRGVRFRIVTEAGFSVTRISLS